MAIWISKKQPEKHHEENEFSDKKKKDEKKIQSKRIDNMRIPQQLKITLKSLGTQVPHVSYTKDLSVTGVFVLCKDVRQYPFQASSTILDATIDSILDENGNPFRLQFLGKIARVVTTPTDLTPAGFGLRMIQISMEHRQALESYIARHGAPEVYPAGQETDRAISSSGPANSDTDEQNLPNVG